MAGGGIRGLAMSRIAKNSGRKVGKSAGGLLNLGIGVTKNSVRKMQAVRRYADGRRVRQSLNELELRDFEEHIVAQMSEKKRVESVLKLKKQILNLGIKGAKINSIVLGRLSLYLMPALEEMKRQIKNLPPEQEAKAIRNVMTSINISLRVNNVVLARANIPTLDKHIKQSIDKIIYKTLPQQR